MSVAASFGVTGQDIFLVLFLVFLEGILSVDNALVLALAIRHLPGRQQRRALTYGLFGAFIFRFVSLGAIQHLMRWRWLRFVGGGYLIVIAVEHLIRSRAKHPERPLRKLSFWQTILLVEFLDIAFAVDSILAAVALSPKFWVVFTGGMLGVIMMRFAASGFGKALNRFPAFETSAYLLVGTIGIKMIIEGLHLRGISFDSPSNPAFWVFWGIMGAEFLLGFKRK